MTLRETLQGVIRPSTTRSTLALWGKSLLNAVLFFGLFVVALPWLFHHLLRWQLPWPPGIRTWLAGALALSGVIGWIACLDAFSRHGRGTPLPADAPRLLVTTGLYGRLRNPIMAAELSVIWAVALHLASLGAALYAVAVTALAQWVVVHVEEPELRRRFGRSYEEYCRRVPRWLPRPDRRTGSV
jgi:protein-S-isoprenylcysteine O-methyltransferase Ste14